MTDFFDAWKFVAGIGIFIYAMMLIEDALKNLAGRTFKKFLKKQTGNPVRAIAGGTIVTALLQSSSLVSLMVLAFVGVGTISMKNAFAIILGTNLGTTLDSWIVAGLGFKFNLETYTYPLIAISVLTMLISKKKKKVFYTAMLFLGIAFLFMGIEFMKSGTVQVIESFDLRKYTDKGTFFFLIVGFVITSVIQSSSATMAIALSALHSGLILLPAAAALVIGSEVGTTLKLLLASISGSADKKRVAVGNIIYNLFITLVSFALLTPILMLITEILGIKDALFALVSFQTLINLLGILLLFPVLKPYTAMLIKLVPEKEDAIVTTYINAENSSQEETALDIMEMEAALFIRYTIATNLSAFPENKITARHPLFNDLKSKEKFFSDSYNEKYIFLKNLHGEIISFYMKMTSASLNVEYNKKLSELLAAVKYAMFSAKYLKDVAHNLENMRESSHDEKYELYLTLVKDSNNFFEEAKALLFISEKTSFQKQSNSLKAKLEELHARINSNILEFYNKKISAYDITTMLNVNREIYNSFKQILHALNELANEKLQNENGTAKF